MTGQFTAFRYLDWSVELDTGVAQFRFALEGPDRREEFTETVRFSVPDHPPPAAAVETFHRVLDLLYVAIGISYYKAAAPRRVVLEAAPLREKALPWATALFRHGLAEFAYRNDLPHLLELELEPAAGPARPAPVTAQPAAGSTAPPLVPVGGGKDSLVSVETLRRAGLAPVLFAVNPNEIITAVMDVAQLPRLTARRRLDPRLFALNEAGAYNGHVPVTAINSLVAVATAVLHGLGPVVMSNERSASVPNLTWRGHEINHQWSKGLEAEVLLREALTAHAGAPETYFSLLRPLSELHIAKLYATLTGYDQVMTSCNAAFRLTGRSAAWCGECPKCQFVFLALAAFLPRRRLVGIFGADLLDDPRQLPGYRELAGLTRHKPFECVGETEESLAALRLAAQRPEWADAEVIRALRTEISDPRWLPDQQLAAQLRPHASDHLPGRYAQALVGMLGAADAAG